MSGNLVALLGFLAMIVLIGLRMPIGMSMLVVGIGGYISMSSAINFLNYVKTTPYFLFANYTMTVIPLFILMGALAEQSGLARDLFSAARSCLGHRKGGLAMAVIGACTGFGAICGSSVATTATFGRSALPELQRYGYAARSRPERSRRVARWAFSFRLRWCWSSMRSRPSRTSRSCSRRP